MKKLLSILVLFAMVSSVFACRTDYLPSCVNNDSDCLTYKNYSDVRDVLVSSARYNDSISWQHDVVLAEPYNTYTLVGATLTISASSSIIDILERTDAVEITFMGVSLGTLDSSSNWPGRGGNLTTTFDLSNYYTANNVSLIDVMSLYLAYGTPLDATAELQFVKDGCWDWADAVSICQSTLNLTLCQDTSGGSGDNAVVPAPGAVLLSGFGTALVGFVRRRSL